MTDIRHAVFHSMGIPIHLTLVGAGEEEAARYAKKAERIFEEWDTRFSRFREESELARLNQSGGAWCAVGAELFRVIQTCVVLAKETDGVFDPSVGSYLAAAGYGLPRGYALPIVVPDYLDVQFDEEKSAIKLARGQVLEPAGIVKGMAIDAAGEALRGAPASPVSSQGGPGWMINAGGDILTHGAYATHDDWQVGIQFPDRKDAIASLVRVKDEAVATSGDYETARLVEGEPWHHQIDMKSGAPTRGLRSVTVIAKTAAEADTAASVIFLYGLEKGMAYAEERNLPCMMIDASQTMHKNKLYREREISLPAPL